jgi:outer membrane protein assembly factor BamB
VALPASILWTYASPTPPQPAWEGPAKWDAYSGQTNLKSMRNFDPAFFVTVAGDRLFFGSSVDDAAHCIDAQNGEAVWTYYTDGPVRIPPTIDNGKAYFGSDDGYAYCVAADTGTFIWKFKAADEDRFVPSNGKIISLAPVRSGVTILDGRAFFAGSLLPWRPSYLCAVDAATGVIDAAGAFREEHTNVVFQGAMLASADNLYVLQGRNSPLVFDPADGRKRGEVRGAGGAYALITDENTFIAGPDSQKDEEFLENQSDVRSDQMASYEGANKIVVARGIAYLQSNDFLSAFNRKKYLALQAQIVEHKKNQEKWQQAQKMARKKREAAGGTEPGEDEKALGEQIEGARKGIDELTQHIPDCFVWRTPCPMPHGLILAGNALFAGGDNLVAAYDATLGGQIWQTEVDGAAHGIAVANGKLFVSTDRGKIYAFAATTQAKL